MILEERPDILVEPVARAGAGSRAIKASSNKAGTGVHRALAARIMAGLRIGAGQGGSRR